MTHINPAITRATKAVQAAIPKAQLDPVRPVIHFRPPAQWINDPNGTIYHEGFYHVFYQHNPYGDEWGHMHWGHTRSRDLIHWEHLPIALWPSRENGEEHCFSGCVWLNGEGQPMAFYTSVGHAGGHQQWTATSDRNLITWQKRPQNPILDLGTHGGPAFGNDWRDPFIFEERGHIFMLIGADLAEEAVVAIYEAQDPGLVQWRYRGILYQVPKTEAEFLECPNLIKVGDKWVLLYSPYRAVEYCVGDFDVDTCTFSPEIKGTLDHSDDYYATNVMAGLETRCVLLAWIRGWEAGRGWNGCHALPRVLTLAEDGQPRQHPIPELEALRGEHVRVENISPTRATEAMADFLSSTLEVRASILPQEGGSTGIQLRQPSGESVAVIQYHAGSGHLAVTNIEFPFALKGDEPLELHIFYDRSVLEVFANQRETCTKVLDTNGPEVNVEVFSQGGDATVNSLDVWKLSGIYPVSFNK